MEKKPQITPTPEMRLTTGLYKACDLWLHDGHGNGCQFDNDNEYNIEMGKKLRSAYNCTYGAGLNPEKIQEMYKALIEAQNEIKHLVDADDLTTRTHQRLLKINEALNNIKYK